MTFEDRTTQAAARKPFYKRWWFILLTVLIVLALVFFGVVLYEAKRIAGDIDASVDAVSYTHLTLPTILLV